MMSVFRNRGLVQLVLVILTCISAHAQEGKGTGISLTSHTGYILKHTGKLTFTPPPVSSGLEFSFTHRTHGRKNWEAWNRYPIFGINAIWINLGSDELGHAFGAYPFVDVPLFHHHTWSGYAQIGSGLAWLTRHFDRIHNPLNNAIGSHLNNSAAFRIHVDYHWRPHWVLTAGLSFTHFSNGQSQTPNYGINVLGGMLGAQWVPQPLTSSDYLPATEPKTPLRRFGLSTYANLSFREYFAFGGPRYPVYIASLAGLYQFSRINRLHVGVEYEYNQGIYTFSKLNWQIQGDNARRWAASRIMIFVADEFLFGNWAILVQAGTYIGGVGDFIPLPVYNKLALRYYLPYLPWTNARFFGGLTLKSHMITAEYIALGMGVTFD